MSEPLLPAEVRDLIRSRYEQVALIGSGRVGASLLLALRRCGRVALAVGWDRDRPRAEGVAQKGAIDRALETPFAAVAGADLVILDSAPGEALAAVEAIAGALSRTALLLEVGSARGALLGPIERILPIPGRYVGVTPILPAGAADATADSDLFRDRLVLLSPAARTIPEAIEASSAIFEAVGARAAQIDPDELDALLALPHEEISERARRASVRLAPPRRPLR